MPEHPMTETEEAVERLTAALKSFSATVKSATEVFLTATSETKRLRTEMSPSEYVLHLHRCVVLENENAELRQQRSELRSEVRRLSSLANSTLAAHPVTG